MKVCTYVCALSLYPLYLWYGDLCFRSIVGSCICPPSRVCRIWRIDVPVLDLFGDYCMAL